MLAGSGSDLATIDALLASVEAKGLSQAMRSAMASRELRVFRAADDLSYVGSDFVGSWIVSTPEGLILFDAMSSKEDVDAFLLPGMAQLGLDPAKIRYLVVTHGHYDHAGGAAYLLRRYRPELIMSEVDWKLWNAASPAVRHGQEPLPRPARFARDGYRLVLGEDRVELFDTPGHTPGTISVLLQVHDRGRSLVLSMWGGNKMPGSLGPDDRTAGLYAYRASMLRFAALSREHGSVGMISTHPLGDGSLEKARFLSKNNAGSPWAIGVDHLMRLFGAYVAVADYAIALQEKQLVEP